MRCILAAVLAVGLVTVPALAADPKDAAHADKGHAADKAHAADHGHGDDHGKSGGGPSIFPKSFDTNLWTLVVFLTTLYLLGRYAWKPILDGLQKREHDIHEALHAAEKARAEAVALKSELQGERDRAAAQVKEMIEEAKRDAQATVEAMKADAQAAIAADRDRMRRELQTETDQALQKIWTLAADLATAAASKALQNGLQVEQQSRLIDDALKQLQTASSGANGHA